MDLTKTRTTVIALVFAPMFLCQPSPAQSQCVPLHDGVEYRAFLPDLQRFVYVDIKVLPGVYPSIFVIADKNFVAPRGKLAVSDPLNQWWIDRSRPMTFSADKVRIRWKESHTFDFVTDLFSDNSPKELSQVIRGLDKIGDHYEGNGATDTNSFAFQSRIEMSGFTGDLFEVSVPAVTFDGATVTPPIIKFERDDKIIAAKC